MSAHDALDQVLAQNRQYEALIGAIAYQATNAHNSTGGAMATIRDLLVKAGAIKAPFTFDDAPATAEGGAAPPTAEPAGDELPAWVDQLGADCEPDQLTRITAVAEAAPEYVHRVEPAPHADPALADREDRATEPECDGRCVDSADIGVPGYGIAYPDPECSLHGGA